MTLILRDHDVRALAGFPAAVSIVANGVVAAQRASLAEAKRSMLPLPGGWLRLMSGTLPDRDLLGYKAFHLTPGGVRYLCALYRLSTGEPLALLDANHLTVVRTSAAAAAAALHLWGERPLNVAVVGSGLQARDGLRALASVCSVQQVRVFSPRDASRRRYASEVGPELGLAVAPAPSAAAATADASLILCATQTGGTVALRDPDAGEARYISSVSSTLPYQRELDEDTLIRAERIIIDTNDAMAESGDLLAAKENGLERSRLTPLADFLAEPADPLTGVTVYKSIGSVEQDLALAYAVWERAAAQGAGELVASIERAKEVPSPPRPRNDVLGP